MKILYVHIGFPRTATKTLQLKLFKKHNGLNYLGRYPDRNPSHNEIISKILSYNEEEFIKNFDNLSREIKNLPLSLDKTNLISDEFFLLSDLLHQKISIKDSIQRLNRLCKINNINLKIIYSVRNQTDIIKSLFAITFLTSLKTDCEKIILAINGLETDTYTSNFLRGFDYNQLHNTLLEILGRDNLSVIFFEKLLISKDRYYEEISSLLGISYSETSKLFDDGIVHYMNNQISTEPELSTRSQLIFHQIKNINLKKIFNRNFISRLLTFFKKKIYPNMKIDKKKVMENRLILNDALIKFQKNQSLIKDYFSKSNSKFFQKNKTNTNIEKFYL